MPDAAQPETRAAGGAAAFDAIVLAGGRSRRLGGTAKATLRIRGDRLVDRAVLAARAAGATRVVTVGPPGVTTEAAVVREDPPFGGPVAGIAAGMAALEEDASPWVLVLACDLARPAEAVAAVIAAAGEQHAHDADGRGPADGVCLDDGRPQWLLAAYRRDALAGALSALPTHRDAAVRDLVAGLRITRVTDPRGLSADLDTWEDVEQARIDLEEDSVPNPLPPEALDEWVAAVTADLGIPPEAVPVSTVLDLARDVAHDVARPAAPLTAFIVGLAVGSGKGTTAELTARVTELASTWRADA